MHDDKYYFAFERARERESLWPRKRKHEGANDVAFPKWKLQRSDKYIHGDIEVAWLERYFTVCKREE